MLPKSPLNLHAHVLAFEQKEGEWQGPPELMDLIKIIGEHPVDAFIALQIHSHNPSLARVRLLGSIDPESTFLALLTGLDTEQAS